MNKTWRNLNLKSINSVSPLKIEILPLLRNQAWFFPFWSLHLLLSVAYDLLEEFGLSESRGVRRVNGSEPDAVAYRVNPSLHLKKSTRYLYRPSDIILFHSFCFSTERNHARLQTISLISCFSESSTAIIWVFILILSNICLHVISVESSTGSIAQIHRAVCS